MPGDASDVTTSQNIPHGSSANVLMNGRGIIIELDIHLATIVAGVEICKQSNKLIVTLDPGRQQSMSPSEIDA